MNTIDVIDKNICKHNNDIMIFNRVQRKKLKEELEQIQNTSVTDLYNFVMLLKNNIDSVIIMGVKDSAFIPYIPDIKSLEVFLSNKNRDNRNIEIRAENGVKGEVSGNLYLGNNAMTTVPISTYPLIEIQCDLSGISSICGVKVFNLFSNQGPTLELCRENEEYETESILGKFTLQNLKDFKINVEGLEEYNTFFVWFGFLRAEVLKENLIQCKSLSDDHKSKKIIDIELLNKITSLQEMIIRYPDELCSHIANINLLNNIRARKQSFVSIVNVLKKCSERYTEILIGKDEEIKILKKLTEKENIINKELSIKDIPFVYMQDLQTDDKYNYYNLFYFENSDLKKIRNLKHLIKRSNNQDYEEDLIREYNLSNVLMLGTGIRGYVSLAEKNTLRKNPPTDLGKTEIYIDDGDVADCINFDLVREYRQKRINGQYIPETSWMLPPSVYVLKNTKEAEILFDFNKDITKIIQNISVALESKTFSQDEKKFLKCIPAFFGLACCLYLLVYRKSGKYMGYLKKHYSSNILCVDSKTKRLKIVNYTDKVNDCLEEGSFESLKFYKQFYSVYDNFGNKFSLKPVKKPVLLTDGVLDKIEDEVLEGKILKDEIPEMKIENIKYPQDPFMNREKVKERLCNEYKKYGKLIIAYDFDYTVHSYKDEDYTYEFIIDLLRKWRPYANYIVFSASPESRYKYIKDYLNKKEIPFDTINSEILERNYSRKVYYNAFLDDRAGLGETAEILMEMYEEIQNGILVYEGK